MSLQRFITRPLLRRWLGTLAHFLPPHGNATIPVAATAIQQVWDPWILRKSTQNLTKVVSEGEKLCDVIAGLRLLPTDEARSLLAAEMDGQLGEELMARYGENHIKQLNRIRIPSNVAWYDFYDAPITKMVLLLLAEAKRGQATHACFFAEAKRIIVRYAIDDEWKNKEAPPKYLWSNIYNHMATMAGIPYWHHKPSQGTIQIIPRPNLNPIPSASPNYFKIDEPLSWKAIFFPTTDMIHLEYVPQEDLSDDVRGNYWIYGTPLDDDLPHQELQFPTRLQATS